MSSCWVSVYLKYKYNEKIVVFKEWIIGQLSIKSGTILW
jgi:hypothetical protein